MTKKLTSVAKFPVTPPPPIRLLNEEQVLTAAEHILAQPTEWIFEGRKATQVRTVRSEAAYSHIVQRSSFDHWLALQAEAAGAPLHLGEPILAIEPIDDASGYRVHTHHGTYASRYIIGADGGRGVSARLLGFSRPKNGAAMEVEIPVSPNLYEQWQDSVTISVEKYPWGYAWVIPRRPVLNLGVGSFRAGRLPLKSLLYEWVEKKLGSASPAQLDILAHPLPYRYRATPLAKSRAVLVGDAAGLMDTLSAEGIYSALLSATLAADTVIAAAASDGPLSAYDRTLSQRLWPELTSATRIGLLFYPFPGFWSKVFSANPTVIEQYLQVAQGTAPYSALLQLGRTIFLKNARLRSGIDNGHE